MQLLWVQIFVYEVFSVKSLVLLIKRNLIVKDFRVNLRQLLFVREFIEHELRKLNGIDLLLVADRSEPLRGRVVKAGKLLIRRFNFWLLLVIQVATC